MNKGCRTNQNYFSEMAKEEAEVVIRNNQLLKGTVDKNLIGTASFGLVHSFFEIFGPKKVGKLFSAFTRLCKNFQRLRGFTCGIGDLILTPEYEKKRSDMMENLHKTAIQNQTKKLNLKIPADFNE